MLAPLAARLLRRGQLRGRVVAVCAAAVITVAGPSLLIAAGQRHVPASLAGILVATSPLLTTILALRLDPKQRSTGRQAVGIVVALAGVVALFGVDLTGGRDELVGGSLILLASLGYALGPFVIRRWLRDVKPFELAALTSAISAVVLLPPAAAALPIGDVSGESAAALVVLGLGGTAVGWYLFYSLIATDGPRIAALAQYLAPGFAVVLGVSLLDEPVDAGVVVGLGLVLAGSWLATSTRGSVEPGGRSGEGTNTRAARA